MLKTMKPLLKKRTKPIPLKGLRLNHQLVAHRKISYNHDVDQLV